MYNFNSIQNDLEKILKVWKKGCVKTLIYLHSSQVRVLFENKCFCLTFMLSGTHRLFMCTQRPNKLWRLTIICFSMAELYHSTVCGHCITFFFSSCKNLFINLCPNCVSSTYVIIHYLSYLQEPVSWIRLIAASLSIFWWLVLLHM